ncbi:MAG TPA: histidine phosphatase family protein [Chloroflexi bacterium]|nr:histidine phosphatase family protein [Chloroflexota bacterium]
MKLILVRHGETSWNKERRVQGGASDIELNDTGMEQARRLANFLKNEPITAILSSPMQRAIATAKTIASHHQLPLEIDHRLKELKVGELEGMSVANVSTTFSQFLIKWWQDKKTTNSPDEENLAELQQRAWKVIESLLERHKTGPEHDDKTTVVVVSHYFVTLAIILKALNLPLDCFVKFRVDLGGVSILEFRDFGTRLVTFNNTSY